MTNERQDIDSHGAPMDLNKTEILINTETGEKVHLSNILAIVGFLDSKHADVLVHILTHTDPYSNQFIGTQKSISEAVGCSLPTVRRTIRKMIDQNILTKTDTKSIYKVNPSFIV